MSNVWDVTPETPPMWFAECSLQLEDKVGNYGPYTQIGITMYPLKGGDPQSDNYFKGQGHNKPWDSHVLPSIRDLIQAGKISTGPELDGKFVSYEWRNWPSYSKKDLTYWRERAELAESNGDDEDAQKAYSKIQIDDKGKEFVNKRYIHFLDVYQNEAQAQAAMDARFATQANSDTDVWGSEQKDDTPIQPLVAVDAPVALALVPNFRNQLKEVFRQSRNGNKGVDLAKAKEILVSPEGVPILGNLDMSADPVQAIVKEVEAEAPF